MHVRYRFRMRQHLIGVGWEYPFRLCCKLKSFLSNITITDSFVNLYIYFWEGSYASRIHSSPCLFTNLQNIASRQRKVNQLSVKERDRASSLHYLKVPIGLQDYIEPIYLFSF